MRKLVVLSFISFDGMMQAPGGPDEDRSGGFSRGGCFASCFDHDLGKGKRLFSEGAFPARFDLIESGVSPKGIIVADYARRRRQDRIVRTGGPFGSGTIPPGEAEKGSGIRRGNRNGRREFTRRP